MSSITDKAAKSLEYLTTSVIIAISHKKEGGLVEKLRQQIRELLDSISDERVLKIILQFIRGIKGS
jgi:hypothetical protein